MAGRFLERDMTNVVHYFQKRYGLGSVEEITELIRKERDELKEKKAD